jgi:PRTRC genetic system protein E
MFKDLYDVARHTPLHLIITPAGEQLRIIVTPKPTGDAANNAALSKPFSATGTPEDLDREFPEALRKYAGAVNDLRTSIDLPIDLLDAAKKKAAEKETKAAEKKKKEEEEAQRRSDAAKKAAETRAQKAEEERKAKEAKIAAKAAAKAAKKTGGAAAGTGSLQLPGATEAAPAETNPVLIGLPDKAACIADYQQMKLVHGDKLTRRLFIKKGKTGRRYEKLWKNWDKFIKAATAQLDLPLAQASTGSAASTAQQAGNDAGTEAAARSRRERWFESSSNHRTIPIAVASDAPAAETGPAPKCDGCKHNLYTAPYGQLPRTTHPHSRCKLLAVDVPMITDGKDKWLSSLIPPGCPVHEASRPVKGLSPHIFTDVFDEAGVYLSSITTKPEIGKHLHLGSRDVLLRITAIDARPSGGLDVTVVHDPEFTAQQNEVNERIARDHPADKYNKSEAAPSADAGTPGAEAAAPAPAPEKKFAVYTAAGQLVKESKWPFTSGERIEIAPGAEFVYRVVGADPADEHRLIAEKFLAEPMQITDESGRELGATDAIYVPADKVVELTAGDFRVIDIRVGGGYVVRDYSKPRWRVWNANGEELGYVDAEPAVGDTIDVGDHKGLKVFEVDGYDCSAAKPRIKGPVAAVEGA